MCACVFDVRVCVRGFPLTPRRYTHTQACTYTRTHARTYVCGPGRKDTGGARTQTTGADTPTNPVARASPRTTACPGRYSRTSIATRPDGYTGLVRCRVHLSDILFYRQLTCHSLTRTHSLSLSHTLTLTLFPRRRVFRRTLHAPHHVVSSTVDDRFSDFFTLICFSVRQNKRFRNPYAFPTVHVFVRFPIT